MQWLIFLGIMLVVIGFLVIYAPVKYLTAAAIGIIVAFAILIPYFVVVRLRATKGRERTVRVCLSCGFENPAHDVRYCAKCGSQLDTN